MKPCPNPECPGNSLRYNLQGKMYRVECRLCHLRGPSAKSQTECIRLWNLLPRLAETNEPNDQQDS